jgi:hypothetical protein
MFGSIKSDTITGNDYAEECGRSAPAPEREEREFDLLALTTDGIAFFRTHLLSVATRATIQRRPSSLYRSAFSPCTCSMPHPIELDRSRLES